MINIYFVFSLLWECVSILGHYLYLVALWAWYHVLLLIYDLLVAIDYASIAILVIRGFILVVGLAYEGISYLVISLFQWAFVLLICLAAIFRRAYHGVLVPIIGRFQALYDAFQAIDCWEVAYSLTLWGMFFRSVVHGFIGPSLGLFVAICLFLAADSS